MRIAVDVMGSDKGCKEIIEGVKQALNEINFSAILIGNESNIKDYIDNSNDIEILPADEIIGMDEKPSFSIKFKKNSSIVKGIELIKEGEADAFVSAGNSGAIVFAVSTILGKINKVLKPALATFIPTSNNYCVLIDSGANLECKPINLFQFGLMGSIYFSEVFKVNKPKIGLVSIGKEETKGNRLSIGAFEIFKRSKIENFVGNIEGSDILSGIVDVLVCDGFVGNVILKFGEGVCETILSSIEKETKESIMDLSLSQFFKSLLNRIKKRTNYAEYGGAALLGVNGNCIICHGKSNSRAVKNAIKMAIDLANRNINQKISEEISKYETWS